MVVMHYKIDKPIRGLEIMPGYPIFIGYNRAPKDIKISVARLLEENFFTALYKKMHIDEELYKKILSQIEKRYSGKKITTMENIESDKIKFFPIDFYSYENALIDFFSIFYTQKKLENKILINISGGTKLTTIAAAFAAALTGNVTLIYFLPEKVFAKDDEIFTAGANPKPISINTFFDISKLLPKSEQERNILIALKDAPAFGLGEVLKRRNLIDKITDERSAVSSYFYYARKLETKNLLIDTGEELLLTPKGKLIGRILAKKEQIDKSVQLGY